jgi:hypothetical protein
MTKLQTILLAVLSAVIAGLIYKFVPDLKEVGTGFAGLALLMLGWAKQHPADAPKSSTEDVTKPNVVKLPNPSSGTPVVALLALGTALLLASPARAETPQALGCLDSANMYCVVPSSAVGMQVNLQNGSVANGVVLLGAQLQHTFGSLPLGAGIFGGLGASSNNQRSYQACGGLSITNWGLVCIGAQRATFSDGSSAWQGMLTLAGQLTFGGTPSYVQAKGGGQ